MSKNSVAPIYTTSFQFETKGKQINVTKIVKGLARQMNRQYIGHKATKTKNKVSGKLVTTRKGLRLTEAQKRASKRLL